MNEIRMFFHSTFLRITMITDRVVVESFRMNWFSMLFQNDFFRRIIVTTLAVLWHAVLMKMIGMSFISIFQKNLTQKFSSYFWLNQIRMFFIPLFWEPWSQTELMLNLFFIWTGLACSSNWLFQKNHSHNFSMFCDMLSSWKWLACLS